MVVHPLQKKRRGAVMIESAIVYPTFFMLTLGMIVISMGIFRYQEVSMVAHEAARYASVRGASYCQETGQTSPTEAQLRTYITNFNLVATADPTKLTTTVVLNTAGGVSTAWDSSTKQVYTYDSSYSLKKNHVSVTVTYSWTPEYFLVSTTIPLTSTSTVDMQY